MTTVLICDDVAADREMLRRGVSALPTITRVAVASSGEEVLARYTAERPDVILMDVRMPGIGGIEATRRLKQAHPEAVVVMLTSASDPEGVGRAVEGGARGYIAKDASEEELSALISLVLGSGSPSPTARRTPPGPAPVLSEREQQVLEGMSRGLSNIEIGKELYLSADTVKTHARRLFRKLDAADRAAAVANGFRWGLLR